MSLIPEGLYFQHSAFRWELKGDKHLLFYLWNNESTCIQNFLSLPEYFIMYIDFFLPKTESQSQSLSVITWMLECPLLLVFRHSLFLFNNRGREKSCCSNMLFQTILDCEVANPTSVGNQDQVHWIIHLNTYLILIKINECSVSLTGVKRHLQFF